MIAAIIVLLLFLLLNRTVGFGTFYYYTGLLALIGHIAAAYLVLPILPYEWDIEAFHDVGTAIQAGELPVTSSTVTAFGTVQGIFYTLFGADPTVISVINGLFAVLIPLPVAYLASKLYGEQLGSTNGVVALVLFLPIPFLFFTIPMRDALIVFTVCCTLAMSVHVLTETDFWMGAPLGALLAIVYLLRPEWALILLLGIGAGIAIRLYNALEFEFGFSALVAVCAVLGGAGFALFAEFLYSFEQVNEELLRRTTGGAVYLEGMQYGSWLDFVIAAPARAIYFQFAPFPLHVETVFHLFALGSSVVVLVFAIAAVRSLYACATDDVVLVTVLVVYVAGITGYGLINSNFGTNVRHRIPFVFLLLVFAAPVIQRWELAVRQWLGVWPDEYEQDDRQQRETQELDRYVEPRQ